MWFSAYIVYPLIAVGLLWTQRGLRGMHPLDEPALPGWARRCLLLQAGGMIGLGVMLLMFPVVTIQIARFAGQVNFGNTALFIGYGITLVAFALGVYHARGNWRLALS